MTFLPPTEAMTLENVTINPGGTVLQHNDLMIQSSATITMGKTVLTEDKLQHLDDLIEFMERFTQENEQARELWAAIKTKRRILR